MTRLPPIKALILLCIAIYLCIHYHLFREYRKILIENEKDDERLGRGKLLSSASFPTLSKFKDSTGRKSGKFRKQPLSKYDKTIATATKNSNTTSFLEAPQKRGKWAYAFLVSGCSEDSPGYMGFLYNCVVAATILRNAGSVADVVVMVQMSESTESNTLPAEEEKMLSDNGIRIRYLPKMRSSDHECFYALVQEKFRVLEMTEYTRVLFLDGDVIPLCNLDYMFKLSEPSASFNTNFKEPLFTNNVILAGRSEAAHAGFFMLTPRKGDWEHLQSVIRKKEEKALTLPWPHWDEVEGWGHEIVPPDYWVGKNSDKKKTLWDWHAVFADQGLLYYWTKYVKMDVSIITGHAIEKWSRNKTGEGVFRERIESPSLREASCSPKEDFKSNPPPYRDYYHFTGLQKPWLHDLRTNVSEGEFKRYNQNFKLSAQNAEYINLWRSILLKVQERTTDYDFTLSWNGIQPEPPMGRFSTYAEMIRHIKSKKEHDWTHYRDQS